jgi:DNA-binding transcriptional ArsR family regulator
VLPEGVNFCDSSNYDFLSSLFRLQNNELIMERFKRLPANLEIEPNERILKWVEKTRKALPDGIREKLGIFFDRESFFALFLTNHIATKKLMEPESLLSYLSTMSDKDLIVNFLCSGHGFSEEADLLKPISASNNERELIEYISKNMAMPTKQKADLLKLCNNPSAARKELIHLLLWYNERIYEDLPFDPVYEVEEQRSKLYGFFEKYGKNYVQWLTGSSVRSGVPATGSITIAVSFFYEIILLKGSIPYRREDIYVVGYRYPERITPPVDKMASGVDLFTILANDVNLRILKRLSQGPMGVTEIALSTKLTNVEVTDYLSVLMRYGVIEDSVEGDRRLFNLNKNFLIKTVGDSVNEIFGEAVDD